MPKKQLTITSDELQKGDVIVYSSEVRPAGKHWLDVEREEPYKTGTILLIKTGAFESGMQGADYTLEQVVHRIASGDERGSWLSTRGGGGGPVNFYSNDKEIDDMIAKSGGVEVLREGKGA